MNISRTNITDLNAVLTLQISKEDYKERLDNSLREARKNVALKGFRQGKVPMGMIEKMYGKQVLLEELNKVISESLDKYVKDEKLRLLGEPLPAKTEKQNNLDTDTDFEFAFEIGLSPEFEINLSQLGEVDFFNIQPEEKLINDHINNLARQNGVESQMDIVEHFDERITVDFEQLDEKGAVLENGIKSQDSFILLSTIKNEETKNIFSGVVPNQVLTINPKTAFENASDVALMLKIEKEQLENINSNFNLTIKSISRFIPAELNSELYDKIFPEQNIQTLDEFKAKITEDVKAEFEKSSNYKFGLDVREKLMELLNLQLPSDFLHKWISQTNEKLTKEQIDSEFPLFLQDFKWQLIKDKIFGDNEIVLEETALEEIAKASIGEQFRRYGLNLPDENLSIYAKETLKKKEERRKYENILIENKIVEVVKNAVTLNHKTVSMDEFNQFFKKDDNNQASEEVNAEE